MTTEALDIPQQKKSFRHFMKFLISVDQPEKIAFIGPSREANHGHLIEYSKRFCDVVHVYDRDPWLYMAGGRWEGVDFIYCIEDVIFDETDLSDYDLIVVFSQEKMYPIAKKQPGNYVLVVDKKYNNGNCTDEKDLGVIADEVYMFKSRKVIIGESTLR